MGISTYSLAILVTVTLISKVKVDGTDIDIPSALNCTSSEAESHTSCEDDIENLLANDTKNDQFDIGIITLYKEIRFLVYGIYLPFVFIVGIIGNGITFICLHKGALNASSSVYLKGLALSDIVYLSVGAPWCFTVYTSVTVTLKWKTFYSFYLAYVIPVMSISYTVSVWIILAFTLERFVIVVYPLKGKQLFTSNRSKLLVLGMYALGVCVNTSRFFAYAVLPEIDPATNQTYFTYRLTDTGRSWSYTSSLFWLSFLFNIAIPFVSLLGLNTALITKLLSAQKRAQKELSMANSVARSSRNSQITRILFAIVLTFFICNSLSAVLNVLVALKGRQILDWNLRTILIFANVLLSTNSTLNFILYAVCSRAMRKAFAAFLYSACGKRTEDKPTCSNDTRETRDCPPQNTYGQ